MKLLVYTCVFNGYDLVLSPVRQDPALDYVVVTEDPDLRIDGWRTLPVDPTGFGGARAANRYYKMLGHRIFEEYSASIYIDGNIRMLGNASQLLRQLINDGLALGVFRHPIRGSIAAEVKTCTERGKFLVNERNQDELDDYRADGFTDQMGLVEATILLKNHGHAGLDPAMSLWWRLFERYNSRDQFSLPYVLWKTGVPFEWQPRSFREPNPYFGIYPHLGAKDIPKRYTYVAARAYDSFFYRILLNSWHAKWRLQRWLRGTGRSTR